MRTISTLHIVVLVVEDEPIIRMDAVDIIRCAGFEVAEASNADDAIRVMEHQPEIQIVFTDINMPGNVDGLQFAQSVRDRWPPVGIVVTSGHIGLAADDLPRDARFLPKPYGAGQLRQALHAFV